MTVLRSPKDDVKKEENVSTIFILLSNRGMTAETTERVISSTSLKKDIFNKRLLEMTNRDGRPNWCGRVKKKMLTSRRRPNPIKLKKYLL